MLLTSAVDPGIAPSPNKKNTGTRVSFLFEHENLPGKNLNRGNRKRGEEEIIVNGKQMEKKVNDYKYLGEYINEKGSETKTFNIIQGLC